MQWERTENKGTIAKYTAAFIVILWLVSQILAFIGSFPLLPYLLELVGLMYTGWFAYRFLIVEVRLLHVETFLVNPNRDCSESIVSHACRWS